MSANRSELLALALGCYALGSLSFAVIVSRWMGLPDPRSFGSGNPGATNMLRGGNRWGAAWVLLGDALKGWAAVWISINYWPGPAASFSGMAPAVAALAVFAGHGYPFFFGFRGGKGVATALGILVALNPVLGLSSAAVWLGMMALTRISSLSALSAALAAPALGWWQLEQPALQATVLLLSLWLLAHHHANIRRLLSGEESVFKRKNSP